MIENSLVARSGEIPVVGDGDAPLTRKPAWLRRPMTYSGKNMFVTRQLSGAGLHTVCDEAKCPNKAECWSRGTATFLIMGDTCTRNCGFCNVAHGTPKPLDDDEPRRLCETVQRLGLRHVVITSVTRDDIADGGASLFARTIRLLRCTLPHCTIEILIPDFRGNEEALAIVVQCKPDVFNHNMETVARLYPTVRPQASYKRSLGILSEAAKSSGAMIVKSGIMVGLGETADEVIAALGNIRETGCSVVTIGQYLQPSKLHIPVREFVTPERFKQYEASGRAMGFRQVCAGPFVRSSYKAAEVVTNK